MKNIFKTILTSVLLLGGILTYAAAPHTIVTESTVKPWAYWWWMGNSVTKQGITENLKTYQEAGFGGMHIIPIYGEKGDEENYIDFLSPQWMDILEHTVVEAQKLGMQIDMTTGTGWPFGGPQVSFDNSAQAFKIKSIKADEPLDEKAFLSDFKIAHIAHIVGVTNDGLSENISFKKDDKDIVTFNKEEKYSPYLALIQYSTRQKVKRAAPGGKGLVMDYFNDAALDNYMQPFEDAFENTTFTSAKVRSFYHDSYEVYGANYTTDFLQEFQSFNGYDLLAYLNVLHQEEQTEQKERIVSDYCATISELLYTEFTLPWVKKSHEMDFLTRNQAHGSPGNILDLYAAVDIPETESFGVSDFSIPGVRQDADFSVEKFGRPSPLTIKFSSSAAHIKGRELVSSETSTWLGDHFKVALSQIKPHVDETFVSGVNHIIFHGVTYNPPEKPFPGRLFYASTNYGPHSHFFDELPKLNTYIKNCQTVLQNTKPDNDILLYFPLADIWSKKFDEEYLARLTVHHFDHWLSSTDLGNAANYMWDNGYGFDYVSDRLLSEAKVSDNKVHVDGGTYTTIVVPECTYISEKVMQQLLTLSQKGVNVLFHNNLPQKVNGYYKYEERENALSQINKSLMQSAKVFEDLGAGFEEIGARNENMSSKNLSFIRKTQGEETVYFVSNLSDKFHSGDITLSVKAEQVVIYDPQTEIKGEASSETVADETTIRLQLEPGQSCFLFCKNKKEEYPQWAYYKTQEAATIAIDAPWTITPISGEPTLPKPVTTDKLVSWTEFGGDYSYFSGKANYSSTFELDRKQAGQSMLLDLGDVRETAAVKINGVDLGVLWCVPYQVIIPESLLKKKNTLEITVTNLSFNRVIDLDKKKTDWKNFNEINFVNIKYEPYDASDKTPVSSGLLGKITLIPIMK